VNLNKNKRDSLLFFAAIAVGVALRAVMLNWPGNYDLESYKIVADLALRGENVYAATDRYNYAPLWMGVIAALKAVAGPEAFRVGVWCVLTATDIGIAWMVRRWVGVTAGAVVMLAPWSILITGHHHQFDNVAVLAALLAMRYAATRPGYAAAGGRLDGLSLTQTVVCAALLGVSLLVKHAAFLFPVWMAFRVAEPRRRAIFLLLPAGIFLASFLPFWVGGGDGILANVFQYRPIPNAPFLNTFGPAITDTLLGCKPHTLIERGFFYAALIVGGALLRCRSLLALLAFYFAFVVVFTVGIFNHYLALATLFCALYRNGWTLLFQLLAIPFYFFHHDGLRYGINEVGAPRNDLFLGIELYGQTAFVVLLTLAVGQGLFGAYFRRAVAWTVIRIRAAIRGEG